MIFGHGALCLAGSSTMSSKHGSKFEAELAKPRTTPFLAVAAHHPLYSNGRHRDNPMLIAQWDSLLRRHNVDLYLSGHDHDLQHLGSKVIPRHLSSPVEEGAEFAGWT